MRISDWSSDVCSSDLFTFQNRKVEHLYVSIWYMGAALFWFPILFLVGNLPSVHFGVEQATMNWWFGHNVLGLFYTPVALASVYYFLSKIIGRPIQSYNLSWLGFCALASICRSSCRERVFKYV